MAKFEEGLAIYQKNLGRYADYKTIFYLVLTCLTVGLIPAVIDGGNQGRWSALFGVGIGIVFLYDMLSKSRFLNGNEKYLVWIAQQENTEVNYLAMSLHSPWLSLPRYGWIYPYVMMLICLVQIVLWGTFGYMVYARGSRPVILILIGVSLVIHLVSWLCDRRPR